MRSPRILAVGAGSALAVLAATPAAGAGSLPTVSSGARPGPPMLYQRPPQAPQLENHAPFDAKPLLVSGTDAYRGGEYLYQDYLFDDRGADTVDGSAAQRDSGANFSFTRATSTIRPPSATPRMQRTSSSCGSSRRATRSCIGSRSTP